MRLSLRDVAGEGVAEVSLAHCLRANASLEAPPATTNGAATSSAGGPTRAHMPFVDIQD